MDWKNYYCYYLKWYMDSTQSLSEFQWHFHRNRKKSPNPNETRKAHNTNNAGQHHVSFQTVPQATGIRTVWHPSQSRNTHEGNGIERPRNKCTCLQSVYLPWRCQKYTETICGNQLKSIKDVNVRTETVKLLEETIRERTPGYWCGQRFSATKAKIINKISSN
jgi:hypothetical protein